MRPFFGKIHNVLSILYAILFIGEIILQYTASVRILWIGIGSLGWIVSYTLMTIFIKHIEFFTSPEEDVVISSVYVGLTFIFPAASFMLSELLTKKSKEANDDSLVVIFYGITIVLCTVVLFLTIWVAARLTSMKLDPNVHSIPEQTTTNQSAKPISIQTDTNNSGTPEVSSLEPEDLLGKDNGIIDRVIKSTLSRAKASIKISKYSLYFMVALVILGGGLSIGTIALDQFSKVREIENHRLTLLKIQQEVSEAIDVNNRRFKMMSLDDTVHWESSLRKIYKSDTIALNNINKAIASTYGSRDSYRDLLDSISKQSNFSITEIIMRIAIAALTLFLVQVFFHIYRYNQQQATHLFTKAEVLELHKEDGDTKNLREILASKLEGNPKFGRSPSTPVEQIINFADKRGG